MSFKKGKRRGHVERKNNNNKFKMDWRLHLRIDMLKASCKAFGQG
jgi:hypothetical protein